MSKKTKIFKLVLLGVVLAIAIAVTAYLVPVIKELGTPEGQQAFQVRVNDSGFLGILMLFGLQFAQIFLFIIPGEPIEILAGVCYGSIWGTVFIMISAAIISAFIYLLVHKLGRKFIYDFVSKEKIEKIENNKIFQNPKTIRFLIFILFFIPGTPKDLLTYIAALLPIKPIEFIIISTIARFPSVISSTWAGASLLEGNWQASLLIYGVTFLIVAIIVIIMRKFDKDKITDEAIRTIK
ncbi:MAG: TVP38/TMEM64 family protein [Clostridia bacterium]|nr:TVP38/TMEM64 family protein [Clostridia bacterium]